ncbi:MAG: helix-turn-helix domain-containing protein [Rhizobiaceae bacterium]|nr:helix-turn-helix domain-containing protein [Rhizobiaceae bacterium]
MKANQKRLSNRQFTKAEVQDALQIINDRVSKRIGIDVNELLQGLLPPGFRNSDDDLIPARTAAKSLGLSPKTLTHWRGSGTNGLPHVQIGSRIFYKPEDLRAFVQANHRYSTSERGGNN